MFDYSYLNRISTDSKVLHLEVLEIFQSAGKKYRESILTGMEQNDPRVISESLKGLFSSLRILGLTELFTEAERLEAALSQEDSIFGGEERRKVSLFAEDIRQALLFAEEEIEKYRTSSTKV